MKNLWMRAVGKKIPRRRRHTELFAYKRNEKAA